jgi:dihydrofolate reductase
MAKSSSHKKKVPARAKTSASKQAGRRVRYSVAVSLDGFIAGPNGEADWIIMDPAFDFGALFRQFDTFLLGRRTFEVTRQGGGGGMMSGIQTVVFSRTLRQSDYPNVVITSEVTKTITELKKKPGKDIWLFGGGDLFRSVLDAGLIDTVELAVMPILLSQGVPLLSAGARSPSLRLTETKTLPSGTVLLTYTVGAGGTAAGRPKGPSRMAVGRPSK